MRSRRTRTSPASCSALRCRLEDEGTVRCCSKSMPSTPSAVPRTSCTACRSPSATTRSSRWSGAMAPGVRPSSRASWSAARAVGRIRFRDHDITRLPPHRRAKYGIGYAPENSGIFPELTVAENLMISRWLSDKTARGAAGERRRGSAGIDRVSGGRQVPQPARAQSQRRPEENGLDRARHGAGALADDPRRGVRGARAGGGETLPRGRDDDQEAWGFRCCWRSRISPARQPSPTGFTSSIAARSSSTARPRRRWRTRTSCGRCAAERPSVRRL